MIYMMTQVVAGVRDFMHCFKAAAVDRAVIMQHRPTRTFLGQTIDALMTLLARRTDARLTRIAAQPSVIAAIVLASLVGGCVAGGRPRSLNAWPADGGRVSLVGGANQWLAVQLEVVGPARITLEPPRNAAGRAIEFAAIDAGRIQTFPAAGRTASLLRTHGPDAVHAPSPAVVPLPVNESTIQLTAAGPTSIWIDLQLPLEADAGRYTGTIRVADADGRAEIPLELRVADFVLPDRRSLLLTGRSNLAELRTFDDSLDAGSAVRLSRDDSSAVRLLDQLIKLSARHRTNLHFADLAPVVTWTPGSPPAIDWKNFDSLTAAWLDGSAFSDGEPLRHWPLPTPADFDRYATGAKLEYTAVAALHLDSRGVLRQMPIDLRNRSLPLERFVVSYPRLFVMTDRPFDAVESASADTPLAPEDFDRIIAKAPGLVAPAEIRHDQERTSPRFLELSRSGITVSGDLDDLRAAAMLAWLRGATILDLGDVSPVARGNTPDASRLAWFYPGSWFGVDSPVPTLALKRWRLAQQDAEWLELTKARGSETEAVEIARQLVRPVEIRSVNADESRLDLLSNAALGVAWREAVNLLADAIELRKPGEPVDENRLSEFERRRLQFDNALGSATLFVRETDFRFDAGKNVVVELGVDVYDTSDGSARRDSISIGEAPAGWSGEANVEVAPPAPFSISSASVEAVARVGVEPNPPPGVVRVDLRNGDSNAVSSARAIVPVARALKRDDAVTLDGVLADWTTHDTLLDGPMVRMADRPTLQAGRAVADENRSAIFCTWNDDGLQLAFKLDGVSRLGRAATNFVQYESNRAWGEDVVEVLIQPINADDTRGRAISISVKPTGGIWTTQRENDNWRPFDAAARYATRVDGDTWRGEITLPWDAVLGSNLDPENRPLLRFNVSRHHAASGISASWAGPVDFGRDIRLTGCVVLVDPRER